MTTAADVVARLEAKAASVHDGIHVALARAMDDVLRTADRGLARAVREQDAARVMLLGAEPSVS